MAAANEQLCLTWSDFSNATWDMLRTLLFRGDYADVTLVSDEGKSVRTHKFMLQSCSSFFQSLLSAAQPNPIIYLTNIRLKEIQNLLKFMYLGQVFLEELDLNLFMAAAEKLQIKGLSEFGPNSQMFNQDQGFQRNEPTGKTAMADYSLEEDLSLTLFESSMNMVGQSQQQDQDTQTKDLQKIRPKDELLGVKKEETKVPFPGETIPSNAVAVPRVPPVPRPTELLWNAALDSDLIVEGLPDSQISCTQVYHHCEKCDYKSTKMFNVKKHTAAVHDGVRYPCDLCDYKATETGHLKKHKRSKHASQ